ncbi:C-type lectin protein [Ranid herpesvirus 3]|uniref:C-type lectin protein n=1 Tax=Ranid herpesvirus 3 TaxID=1987509 RepID=A0A1X9T5H9_9VIRU|nr:C-type lectin protein [Ranid herpesvirus 3]ARR28956.1 C-type lectin protein [Ranid herpesvirus 3]
MPNLVLDSRETSLKLSIVRTRNRYNWKYEAFKMICAVLLVLACTGIGLFFFTLKTSTCPDKWIMYDKCYFLGEEKLRWNAASRACIALGAVQIKPSGKLLAKLSGKYWLDVCWNEGWRYTNGQKFEYNGTANQHSCLVSSDGETSYKSKTDFVRYACELPIPYQY